ncbi:MAG: dihydrofolate reductase, partial [Chitinophagaceae bacterium]|nr:dihydrofolate reductase [Chitinophagaceae bacterium]
ISLVVAAANNNAIGMGGKMPWHLPADMRHFKNITWACR